MTMLGRLVHYGIDAIAVSTILAGVKRSTGFAPKTEEIPDSSFRSFTESYLGVGETVFNLIAGQAVSSDYFKKV